MDTISLHELKLETLIGIHDWERRLPQSIQLDLEFAIPTVAAGQTDRMDDTIDYSTVVDRLRDSLSVTRFGLLERLCEHVADILRDEFKSPWMRVSVSKIAVIRGLKRVSVTIERGSTSP
jgi:7,8-dihydroneopterin aldolase/epimerase/oxygenase